MSSVATIKAIRDNLKALLKTTLGVQVNTADVDPRAGSIPVSVVHLTGTHEYSHGERPGYSTAELAITTSFSDSDFDLLEDRKIEWALKLRENVTVAAINTGALSSSKLVSRVEVTGSSIDLQGPPVASVRTDLSVRYRE